MRDIRAILVSCLFITFLLIVNTGYFVRAQSDQAIEITEIGQFDTIGWAANIHVQDDTAIISDSEGGLYIIDVSNPENPSELGHFDEGIDHLHELYVEGNFAYVADYTDGLKIIDISDPASPTQVGRFHDGGEVGTFEVVGDLAYTADFIDGLEIVNISNPSQPTEILQYNGEINYIFNVEVYNELAFVSDYLSATEKKIRILNISDLNNIEEIAEYTINGEVFSIDFIDDVAYMMCSYGGVKIFDISDPASLSETGSYDDGGNAVDFEFLESCMVIADRDDGLEILDISNPANPVEIANFTDGGSASGVKIANNLVFVADGEDGLEILRIEGIPGTTDTTDTSGLTLVLVSGGLIAIIVLIMLGIRNRRTD
ncbi:MAG: hypothetical protein JSW61_10220 [Candidatus Thorarchaeota archaeon]|nr:MAG: hypothetical protein JSW61_10220 [Candidatus Thorarchaeota archaeon]